MSISAQIRHLHRLTDGQQEAIDAELAIFGVAWREPVPEDRDAEPGYPGVEPARPLLVLEGYGVRATLYRGLIGYRYAIEYTAGRSTGGRKSWDECRRDASIDMLLAIDGVIENATATLNDLAPAPGPS